MKLAMKMISNGSLNGSQSKRWALSGFRNEELSRAGINVRARTNTGGCTRVWAESLSGQLDILRAKTTGHQLIL